MSAKLELTGQRFGRLKVLKLAEIKNKSTWWLCKCDCGNTTIVKGAKLRNGHTQSCGCLQKEAAAKALRAVSYRHGGKGTPEYEAWHSMKQRCYNPNNCEYKRYGAKGIRVCDRWLNSFENFFTDMGPRPEGKYSIDRIDTCGNYEPNNCRWATQKQQANNKRTNVYVSFYDQTKTIAQWAELLNMRDDTLRRRLKKGWSIFKALTTPTRKWRRHNVVA